MATRYAPLGNIVEGKSTIPRDGHSVQSKLELSFVPHVKVQSDSAPVLKSGNKLNVVIFSSWYNPTNTPVPITSSKRTLIGVSIP
jgi:hypothetical protein